MMADSNQPRLVLCYLARAGALPVVKDGRLLIGNPQVLCEYDKSEVKHYKREIIALIEGGGVVDDFRWDSRVDQPVHRARALGGQYRSPETSDANQHSLRREEPALDFARAWHGCLDPVPYW